MSAVDIPLDTRGHPTHKKCPGCNLLLGRTRTQCGCGHVFHRHSKVKAVPPTSPAPLNDGRGNIEHANLVREQQRARTEPKPPRLTLSPDEVEGLLPQALREQLSKPRAKSGAKPRYAGIPEVASDAERQLMAIAESKPPARSNPLMVGSDPTFYAHTTPYGGLLIKWPGFGVQFTLTPDELAILRKALAT